MRRTCHERSEQQQSRDNWHSADVRVEQLKVRPVRVTQEVTKSLLVYPHQRLASLNKGYLRLLGFARCRLVQHLGVGSRVHARFRSTLSAALKEARRKDGLDFSLSTIIPFDPLFQISSSSPCRLHTLLTR